MAHPKNDACFFYSLLHLNTVFQVSSHGLLTEDVVALCSKRQHDIRVHLIQNGDDYSIGKPFTDSLNGFGRGCMKFLPGIEDNRPVYFMGRSEYFLCFWSWFRNGNNFAFVWLVQCVPRILVAALSTSNHSEGDWQVVRLICLIRKISRLIDRASPYLLCVFDDGHGLQLYVVLT